MARVTVVAAVLLIVCATCLSMPTTVAAHEPMPALRGAPLPLLDSKVNYINCTGHNWCNGLATITCVPSYGRCVVGCGVYSCYQATLNCPDGQPCELDCQGDHACVGMRVECGKSTKCVVRCTGSNSCNNMEIDDCAGKDCAVCVGTDSCKDLSYDNSDE